MSCPSGSFGKQTYCQMKMVYWHILFYSIAQTTMKKNSAVSTCTTNWPTSKGWSLTSTSGGRSPGCRARDQANTSANQSAPQPEYHLVWGSVGIKQLLIYSIYRFPTRRFPIPGRLHHSFSYFLPCSSFPIPFILHSLSFWRTFWKKKRTKKNSTFFECKKKSYATQNRGPYDAYFLKPFAQGWSSQYVKSGHRRGCFQEPWDFLSPCGPDFFLFCFLNSISIHAHSANDALRY